MKNIGRIIHYTKYKVFVAESKRMVPLNTTIYDDRKRKIGVVADVIGPINKPYLVIKPLVNKPEKYVGKQIYVLRVK